MIVARQLLRDLIALPSVNPALLPPGDSQVGEGRVIDFLTATAAAAGLDVEQQPVFPGRNNLIARLTPSGKIMRRIALVPHADTVGAVSVVPGGPIRIAGPVERGGRMYGRGACDTKGSIAAMLTALAGIARSGPLPAHTELILAVTVDEEDSQTGSRTLVKNGFKADFAIVGEPTDLRVKTAHKGAAWIAIETTGKAAHGSTPWLGKNAIYEMARVVTAIQDYEMELRSRMHPVLGFATVSVGQIKGGRQANIVPERCVIRLDRRTLPGESAVSVRREITSLLRKRKITARVIDTKPDLPCHPLETPLSHPLAQQLMKASGQQSAEGAGFFSDAAILAAGGTPSVLFGPGSIRQAHHADEWISMRDLDRAVLILSNFLGNQP